ncbi:hypothetical protein POSPLADRAFT_1153926, partial [Postia placenta MAD-698-R-SB12]
EEAVQLGPSGPADIEDLLNLGGALVSGLPRGKGLELNLSIDAGRDVAQVPIPGMVRRTLEQRREFCSGTLKGAGGVRLDLTEAMGQEVETEVPRAAEAGLYTWGDKGRLCALVRAQLVCAQHADAAPGAVQRSRVRARKKEKIKKRLDVVSTRDIVHASCHDDCHSSMQNGLCL